MEQVCTACITCVRVNRLLQQVLVAKADMFMEPFLDPFVGNESLWKKKGPPWPNSRCPGVATSPGHEPERLKSRPMALQHKITKPPWRANTEKKPSSDASIFGTSGLCQAHLLARAWTIGSCCQMAGSSLTVPRNVWKNWKNSKFGQNCKLRGSVSLFPLIFKAPRPVRLSWAGPKCWGGTMGDLWPKTEAKAFTRHSVGDWRMLPEFRWYQLTRFRYQKAL